MLVWSGILLGITGSLHCVGMCGPIALALPLGGNPPIKKALYILIYNLGRALTYALLGTMAGITGAAILVTGYQQLLSILGGSLILLSVFFPFFGKIKLFAPAFRYLRETMSGVFARKEKKDLFVLGALNGLLPCGLVYMALAAAMASGNMAEGALFMFLFGLGTFPVMMMMPYAGSLVTERLRSKFRRTVPIVVGSMGLLLLLRGLDLGVPYLSPAFGSGKPACHQVDTDPHSLNTISCIGHDSQATK